MDSSGGDGEKIEICGEYGECDACERWKEGQVAGIADDDEDEAAESAAVYAAFAAAASAVADEGEGSPPRRPDGRDWRGRQPGAGTCRRLKC